MRNGLRLTVLLTALLALVLGLAAVAQAKDKRYRDDVFNKVKVSRDIQYGEAPADSYGERERLKLDLYQPKGDTLTKRPVVIFAHGGGFTAGDKSSGPSPFYAEEFARKGYITASINYRLNGPSGGCTGSSGVTEECYNAAIDAVHDGQAAVRWFRVNARDLGIDKRRIAIGGESAGAILSCGVAVLASDPGSSGNPGPSSAVQSFISISGGLPGGIFVDAKTAPGILFASTEDPTVPYQWSVDMRDKMVDFKVPAKLTTFQSNVHVPFAQYGDVMEKQSTKFIYKQMDVKHAQGA
jgi:dienelactone hydrolase